MAYAALVVLAQELQKILPHHRDYDHISRKEQIESLHSNVTFLQKFFEDFPGNSSSVVKQLESRITDVAYELRDIIGWETGKMRHRRTYKCCMDEVNSIVEDASDIRKVLEMKKSMLGCDSWTTCSSTAAPRGKDSKVGLDKDLIQIKEQIFGHVSTLQIIPIVGTGGIGKTTLAKNVYEDPLSVAQFDLRVWVTVSRRHWAQDILKEILGIAITNIIRLVNGVHLKLTGRRFLIVMDGMWNVETWEKVRNAFPDDNNGSRIIVTTRLPEVATKIGSSSSSYQIQLMNEDESWELFEKEVIGQERFLPHLESIGKIISKNCKGLPLAVVVIARLLKLNHTQDYWKKIAKNINKAMMAETNYDQLMEIISDFSYDNLPPHLKACFLYTSMFPEDYEIPSKNLIWLWVAEGFLKPTRHNSIEETARRCLEDLIERNLISIGKKRSNGRIRTCIVRDVMRDLSLRKAKEDKFSQQLMTHNIRSTNFVEKLVQKCIPWHKDEFTPQETVLYARRVSVTLTSLYAEGDNTDYGYVYSFTCHSYLCTLNLPYTFRSKLLRVLDILEVPLSPWIELAPPLVNLRYLAFTFDYDLDWAMFKNLETLVIRNNMSCIEPLSFPILQMPKLKHFIVLTPFDRSNYFLIDYCYCLEDMSSSILTSMQTLSGVTNFEFTTDALETFGNLIKLKIQYSYTEDSVDWERVRLENLAHMRQLEELTLRFHNRKKTKIPLLLTNIVFPDNLKQITLKGFIISWENMSAIGSLPNLEVLKLVNCWFESDEWEPVVGEFLLLKYLKLDAVNLEQWKVESSHFPCLEQLIIRNCERLYDMSVKVGEIESLQKLVVHNCKTRVGASARKILKEQQSSDNYQLQVDIVDQPKKWWEKSLALVL